MSDRVKMISVSRAEALRTVRKRKMRTTLEDPVPDIGKYWDYDRNEGLLPSEISPAAHVSIWTMCPSCGTPLYRSVRCTWEKNPDGTGSVVKCRKCTPRKKGASLVESCPDILKYWDYEKNDKKPDEYTRSSGKKVYISCPGCGRSMYRPLCDSVKKNADGSYSVSYCLECGKEFLVKSRRQGKRNLVRCCPGIGKYWDYDKNEFRPDEISIRSKTKIYVRCPQCGKIRYQSAYNLFTENEDGTWRVNNCQKCAVSKSNSEKARSRSDCALDRKCPEIKEWWDFDKNTVSIKDLTIRSRTPVYLKCPTCGYEMYRDMHSFIAVHRDGTQRPVACPECGYSNAGNPADNLSVVCPEIVKWWNYEKNAPFTPEQFTKGSQFQAYLTCPDCGMELHTGVHSLVVADKDGRVRIRHEGRCQKYKSRQSENNVLKLYPKVTDWWDYEKNFPGRPEDFTIYTQRKAYFKCPDCGLETYQRLSDALSGDIEEGPALFRCKRCNGSKVFPGENDLRTLDPELAKEWSPNNDRKPEEVKRSSAVRFLWICPECNNEYKYAVKDRFVGDNVCPYCRNTKVLKGFNDLAHLDPELAKEWSPNNDRRPEEVKRSSFLYFLWVCPECNNEYEYMVKDRFVGDNACPYCKGKRALKGVNDLKTVDPDLAREWSETNARDVESVPRNSKFRALWICPTCHGEYWYPVAEREAGDDACPYCRGTRVLPGFNDLKTTDPELAAEWSENNGRDAGTVRRDMSSPALWICPACHGEYSYPVAERKIGDDACPYCRGTRVLPGFNDLKTTDPELAAEWSKNNGRDAGSVPRNANLSALWICPTCHGEYSYPVAERKVGDDACPYCRGARVLSGFNDLKTTDPELAAEWAENNGRKVDSVFRDANLSALWICPTCHGEYSYPVAERKVGDDACPYCRGARVLSGFNDLKTTDPELAAEWSENNERDVETVRRDMSSPALWICPTCHGEYSYPVVERKVGDDACPYCRGKRVLSGFNDLKTTDPELAAEWSENNERDVETVRHSMTLRALWVCPTCHGEYSYPVAKREAGDNACPYCRGKRVLPGYNSFKVNHPDLMDEWAEAENIIMGVDPDYMLDRNTKRVWWTCKTCGQKYLLSIERRLMKQKRGHVPCTYCNGRRWDHRFNM